MHEAYPILTDDLPMVQEVLAREEAGFGRSLRTGLGLVEEALATAAATDGAVLAGDVAFRLHDTHGFPIELTGGTGQRGRGHGRPGPGSRAAMAEQRAWARLAARTPAAADEDAYRTLLESEGPTGFVGRTPEYYAAPARVIGVLAGGEPGTAEICLAPHPFLRRGRRPGG